MMATDPFDPNIDRALERRAASRHSHTCNGQPILTIPTLFGVVHIEPDHNHDCPRSDASPEQSDTP